ncbi:MAG: TonB-dependent receptor [Bacteroidetes bacterium]|nr:TonB-dependent receptor [Bacteroidota bacterium]
MLKIFYIFSLLISGSVLLGQSYKLNGKLIDETKQPAIGSSVFVLKTDSSFIKGTTTDVDGQFNLENINSDNYILKILSLGYKPVFKSIQIKNQDLIIPTITLKQNLTNLKEVTIEAQQALATQNGDTTSFKANAYKVNKDATAEDLVSKMPGVTVVDGKVQAQGEEVKQVLVDGKRFFGDDASAVLKNLPAEVIDKVQVFDKKSDQSQFTGFDDGNASKTINIVTKAQFKNGVFGKVYGGYGYEDKFKGGGTVNIFKGDRRITVLAQSNNVNEQNFSSEDLVGVSSSSSGGGGRRGGGQGGMGGGNNPSENFQSNTQNGINTTSLFGLNYADKWGKKTEVTASYFFNWTQNDSKSSLLQQYILGSNNGLVYNENNNTNSDNFNNRINFKIETKIDSMNSIVLQPKLSFQSNKGAKELLGLNTKEVLTLSNTENSSSNNLSGYNISVPILYRHAFAKRGRTFSINATPTITKNSGENLLYTLNTYYRDTLFYGDTIDQKSKILKTGNSINGNVSYTEPLNKNNFLLVNYTAVYTDNYSSKKTFDKNYIEYSYRDLDSTLTNVFKNQYQSQSGSLGYRYQKEKFNFSLNAAYQWAQLSKEQEIPTSYKLSKTFESILPSAQLQYKFSQKKNLRFNYRTSNNAPSIDQLQDVINNSNSLQLSTGNPDLKQDFQQNIFLRYSGVNTNKATSFFALIGGNYSNNYIGNSTLIANQDTTVYNDIFLQSGSQIIRPVNLDGYFSLRSFINYTFPIKKIKTNLSVNVSGNYNNVPGMINTNINYAKTATGGLGLVFSSNISEKFDFTLSSNSSYSNIQNTLQTSSNTNYFSQVSKLKITANPWKGLILQSEYSNTYYSGLTSAFNQSISLWNAAIGYKFLKNKQAELRITVYDILNQNNSVSRTNTDSYIQDSQTNVLNRYYMLTFTYNFKKYFAKKEGSATEQMEGRRKKDQ